MGDVAVDEPKPKRLKTSHLNDTQDERRNGTEQVSPLKRIRVGSRKSQLALFQSNFVVQLLKEKYPEIKYDIITMTTTGDNILNVPLSKIGEKSLFTKELEVALENDDVDIVVHSLKDLPTTLPPGMVIGAICKRDSPYDAVVFKQKSKYKDLSSLPKGSVIGTSSLRRIAQLKRSYPLLEFQSIRGNLNTRLRKLDEDGTYEALILAAAGLERMDLCSRIAYVLPTDVCMYAIGQGAIAVECKANDLSTLELIAEIADKQTTLRCVAERSFMRKLEGGCSVPVAVATSLKEEELTLEGGVFSLDGSQTISQKSAITLNGKAINGDEVNVEKSAFCGVSAACFMKQHLKEAEDLGIALAEMLLKEGAANILEEARNQNATS